MLFAVSVASLGSERARQWRGPMIPMLLSFSLQHTRHSVGGLVQRRPELRLLSLRHDGFCSVDVEDHLRLPQALFFRVYDFCGGDAGIVPAQLVDLFLGAPQQSV